MLQPPRCYEATAVLRLLRYCSLLHYYTTQWVSLLKSSIFLSKYLFCKAVTHIRPERTYSNLVRKLRLDQTIFYVMSICMILAKNLVRTSPYVRIRYPRPAAIKHGAIFSFLSCRFICRFLLLGTRYFFGVISSMFDSFSKLHGFLKIQA